MRLLKFFQKFGKHFAGIFILALFLPTVYFSFPGKAEAFLGAGDTVIEVGPNLWEQTADTIENTANLAENTVSAIANPVTAANSIIHTGLLTADHVKKWVLDPLAMMMAKIIIQQITASTVKWINTGFKGNPAFVQNPEQFFLNIGDQAAATYLSNSNSAWTQFVCTPFSAKIRLALVQSYLSTQTPNKCTISSIVRNWTQFGQNFYDNGGWDGWFSLTQTDSNNPVGSYMQQKDALMASIQSKQGHYQAQLSMGNGFLSWETCSGGATSAQSGSQRSVCVMEQLGTGLNSVSIPYSPSDNMPVDSTCVSSVVQTYTNGGWVTSTGDTGPAQVDVNANNAVNNCPAGSHTQVNTPGSVIAGQLGITLGSPLQQLGVAQSINQIVGALMTQMVKQVVGGFGSGGLSGLSQSSSATQSLQQQLEVNAVQTSPQFTAVQNQITQTDQDVMKQANASAPGSGTPPTSTTPATAPTITLINNGDPTKTSPLTWTQGVAWIDPSFIAYDQTDGNITDQVTVAGSVDTDTAGAYTLTYTVTNSQGVSAIPVMRMVNVVAQGQ